MRQHPAGVLLPESVLYSTWFSLLAAFVAINTVMYVTLAALKVLPVVRWQRLFRRRYRRAQTRSIYPDAVEPMARTTAWRQKDV